MRNEVTNHSDKVSIYAPCKDLFDERYPDRNQDKVMQTGWKTSISIFRKVNEKAAFQICMLILCGVIKQNASELANIDFEIYSKFVNLGNKVKKV